MLGKRSLTCAINGEDVRRFEGVPAGWTFAISGSGGTGEVEVRAPSRPRPSPSAAASAKCVARCTHPRYAIYRPHTSALAPAQVLSGAAAGSSLEFVAERSGLQRGRVCRLVMTQGVHRWDAQYSWSSAGALVVGVIDADKYDRDDLGSETLAWGWAADSAKATTASARCGNSVNTGASFGTAASPATCTLVADMDRRRVS